MYVQRNIMALSRNHYYIRNVAVYFFFSHYLIYSKILEKKHIADKMFGFFYNFEKYLIVRRIQRYTLNLHKSSVIEPVIVVRFE